MRVPGHVLRIVLAILIAMPGVRAFSQTGDAVCKDYRNAEIVSCGGEFRYVSSAKELLRALGEARGGETILLEPGDYGEISLHQKYPSLVTVASANPDKPARLSQLRMDGAQNLRLAHLHMKYEFRGNRKTFRAFLIKESSGIEVVRNTIEGDLAVGTGNPENDGFGTGKGLEVRFGNGIIIEANEFLTWWKALTVTASINTIVRENNVHSFRSDGMNFVDNTGLLVDGNYIHDAVRSLSSGDHADMIQFWNTKKRPSNSKIVIRNNVLDTAGGNYTQLLFFDNSGRYDDILIENNVIIGNHKHGISIPAANNVRIRNNALKYVFAGLKKKWAVPGINVHPNATNVVIAGNIAPVFDGYRGQKDWRVSGNRFDRIQ